MFELRISGIQISISTRIYDRWGQVYILVTTHKIKICKTEVYLLKYVVLKAPSISYINDAIVDKQSSIH